LARPALMFNEKAMLSLFAGLFYLSWSSYMHSLKQAIVFFDALSISHLWSLVALTYCCSSMATGDSKFAQNLQTYLLSRDHSNLKSEFQDGNGKVCLIELWSLVCLVLVKL
jgi:hypothetical protein